MTTKTPKSVKKKTVYYKGFRKTKLGYKNREGVLLPSKKDVNKYVKDRDSATRSRKIAEKYKRDYNKAVKEVRKITDPKKKAAAMKKAAKFSRYVDEFRASHSEKVDKLHFFAMEAGSKISAWQRRKVFNGKVSMVFFASRDLGEFMDFCEEQLKHHPFDAEVVFTISGFDPLLALGEYEGDSEGRITLGTSMAQLGEYEENITWLIDKVPANFEFEYFSVKQFNKKDRYNI